jgi:hypothetical protein
VYEPAIATMNIAIQRIQRALTRDGPHGGRQGRELALALARAEEAEMWLQRAQALGPRESEI